MSSISGTSSSGRMDEILSAMMKQLDVIIANLQGLNLLCAKGATEDTGGNLHEGDSFGTGGWGTDATSLAAQEAGSPGTGGPGNGMGEIGGGGPGVSAGGIDGARPDGGGARGLGGGGLGGGSAGRRGGDSGLGASILAVLQISIGGGGGRGATDGDALGAAGGGAWSSGSNRGAGSFSTYGEGGLGPGGPGSNGRGFGKDILDSGIAGLEADDTDVLAKGGDFADVLRTISHGGGHGAVGSDALGAAGGGTALGTEGGVLGSGGELRSTGVVRPNGGAGFGGSNTRTTGGAYNSVLLSAEGLAADDVTLGGRGYLGMDVLHGHGCMAVLLGSTNMEVRAGSNGAGNALSDRGLCMIDVQDTGGGSLHSILSMAELPPTPALLLGSEGDARSDHWDNPG